jgi:hypothetical protein
MNYILRNIDYNEYLTYFILIALLILMYIKHLYSNQFKELLNLPTNGRYFILYNKGEKKNNLFNILFFLFFTINISVYTYITLTALELLPKNNIFNFLLLFAIINSYFVIKYFIEKIAFNVFDLNTIFENYNFQKLSCINFISLLFLLANIVFSYIAVNPSNILVYFSIVLFLLIYIVSIIIIVLYNQKKFLKHWFYFILYLCALEIAPFIIGAVLAHDNLLNNL